MSDEPRNREGGDEEEEFEPLDRFFAPIEDVDWSEEGDQGAEPKTPAAGAGPFADEELLPAPDIPDDPLAGLDLGEEPEPAAPPGAGQESFPVEPGADAPDPSSWRQTEPRAEDQHELTLEDLKNPPPEYAELPGPPDEVDAGPEEGIAAAAGVETMPLGRAQDVESEEVLEPDLDEVEAAADRFAESLRTGEPEAEPPVDTGTLPPAEQVEKELLSDLEKEPAPPPTVTVGVTESLGGPSWQEPTSREVTAGSTAPAAGGRNLPLAFITGIVLVAIGIGSIALGKGPFTVVVGIVIVLGLGELYAVLHRQGYQPATAVGLVMAAMMTAAAYLRGEGGATAMLALAVVTTFLWFMAIPAKTRQNSVTNIAMTLMPLLYVGFLASFVLMTLALPGGRTLVLTVIALAVGYDIAAFAFGSLWGNRALAPSISPRKSWEGAIGATLILILVAVGFISTLDPFKPGGTGSGVLNALGLALVISVFAPLGDLAESLLKRDLGIKDMGSILPGHGGLLDRCDSILWAAPAAYYFFKLFLF